MTNREVAEVFERIADLLEIKGEMIYRILSYRRAAEAILARYGGTIATWESVRRELVSAHTYEATEPASSAGADTLTGAGRAGAAVRNSGEPQSSPVP